MNTFNDDNKDGGGSASPFPVGFDRNNNNIIIIIVLKIRWLVKQQRYCVGSL